MAKVSSVDLIPGLDRLFWRGLKPSDRFIFSRIIRKQVFFSRRRRRGMSQRSLLPQIRDAWDSLTEAQRQAWRVIAPLSNLTGWRLFVQDQSLRIMNDIPGIATPSTFHQSTVGLLEIKAPATSLKIIQPHPRHFYVKRRVRGTKSQFEPIRVTEDFILPLKIGLNYKSELEAMSPESKAQMIAEVWHSYQGRDLKTNLSIDLLLQTDWTAAEKTISAVIGHIISYNLFFNLQNLRGRLFIDNLRAVHSGQNWARDQFCRDINQSFTRAFFQVPRHWAGVEVPVGSSFESIYKNF